MKKLVSILTAAMLLLCAGAAMSEGQTYTVGVCQLVTHDALDAANAGLHGRAHRGAGRRCHL